MIPYKIVSVRENPEYLDPAVDYFSSKWGIGRETYLDCISHSIHTPRPLPRWYLLERNDGMIAGCYGLITNDFNSRQDLWPWLAALFVAESERGQSLGAKMLDHGRAEAARLGFGRLYLCTDLDSYYERYGWRYIANCWNLGENVKVYESETTSQ